MDVPENDKLKEITEKLSKILRIQDWDIKVNVVSGYEFAEKTELECTCDGACCRNVRLNTAEIYLNKEKDVDWYETLIHELLHIQSTELIHCAEAYFEETHSYFTDIYESLIEKQAQIFCKIYPLEALM